MRIIGGIFMQWIARVSRTHIAIALTGFLSFILCFSYLQSLNKTIKVAKLSKNVDAGKIITTKDVTFVSIPRNETTDDVLITENVLLGKKLVAKVDLSKSDLLTNTNTSTSSLPNNQQSLSIGIEIHRANGGNISKGDMIDIWETGENSRLVTSNISVRSVIEPNKRLGISTNQLITIVVAVTTEQARALSRVIGEDNLMIVLSNGIKSSDEIDSLHAGSEEDEPFTASELSPKE